MVVEGAILNISEIVSSLPPHIIKSVGSLIVILKAVSIAMIVYVIYVVAMGFISVRRSRRIKTIEEKVFEIDKKINKLIKIKKVNK